MRISDEKLTFMGTHWVEVEDATLTIGLNDEGIEAISEIGKIVLPDEGEEVEADDICAEIETDDGPVNVFAPVSGRIVEVNPAISENPALVLEDPYEEGWLFKIEASDQSELRAFVTGASAD